MTGDRSGRPAERRSHAPEGPTPSGGQRVGNPHRLDPHPRIAGRRVTDLGALLGAGCWLALRLASTADRLAVSLVEQFVALALLVLVPLGLGIAASSTDLDAGRSRSDLGALLPYRVAAFAQLPCALAATAALASPVGSTASVLLTVPWLGVTGAVATAGLLRLRSRGLAPIEELAIDAALLYVPVGAVALSLHRAEISLRFRPIIVLLTAVHYHYAGFVLPLVTGRIGRLLAARGHLDADLPGRVTALAIGVIVGNVALIAVGITFSPTVEVVAVALFTTAVVALALATLVWIVPAVDRWQGALLAVATCTLGWTMALAMAYGYSAYPETGRLVTVGQMITWHGAFNAFGFALPALLAFRLRDGVASPDGAA